MLGYSVFVTYLPSIVSGVDDETLYRFMLVMEYAITFPLLYYAAKCGYNIKWGKIVAIYMTFELINAYLFLPIHEFIRGDFVMWSFFLGLFYLGQQKEFWNYFLPFCVIILFITSLMSAYEIITSDFNYIRNKRDEDSYIVKISMGFLPVALALCYSILTKNKRNILICSGVFAVYFIMQFYFQKRLPILRIVLYLALLMFVFKEKLTFKKGILMMSMLALLFVGLYRYVPTELTTATIERFTERGNVSETTQSDERYLIAAKAIYETLESPRTILFGLGHGGVRFGYYFGKVIMINGKEVDGLPTDIEVGIVTLFYKYGICFVLIMYSFLFKLLFGYRKYKDDPLAVSCWLYLAVFVFMSIVGESFPTIGAPLSAALLAGSMGYLALKLRESKIVKI